MKFTLFVQVENQGSERLSDLFKASGSGFDPHFISQCVMRAHQSRWISYGCSNNTESKSLEKGQLICAKVKGSVSSPSFCLPASAQGWPEKNLVGVGGWGDQPIGGGLGQEMAR